MDISLEKSRINLADVVRSSGVELSSRGPRSVGLCPFHSEKTPSFTVFEGGRYHCFGCHESGDVIDFVQRRYDLEFIPALEFLGIEKSKDNHLDHKRLIKELALKKAEDRKQVQHERDILHTLSLLIRTTRKVKLTPENFDENAGILQPLEYWQYCHDTLIHGSDEEKQECINALQNMPTVSRNYLFEEDFDYRGWLRNFIYGEPKNEKQRIRISFGGT